MSTEVIIVIVAIIIVGVFVTLIICRNRIPGFFYGLIRFFYCICGLSCGLLKLFSRICGLLCGGRSSKKKEEPLGNDSGLFKKEENDSGLFKKEVNDSQFTTLAMDRFLDDMEREKPIRFTSQHLIIATDNFTIKLGSGGFGTVYKGIISNKKPVAVKVLNGTSDKTIEQQFMAEISTLGRTHHFNLVRLYGFCFESSLRALVYEFMVNGSLDHYLFQADKKTIIGFEKLHEIALGSARGITYLHEECHQKIVHYDIKPGNILLDSNFCAKVADFGLAKLCSRDSSRMTGRVGTPGYTAPEVWMSPSVTHKCDVYSFGMLLFEIIGKRRNMDTSLGESQEWFSVWAWGKYEKKQLKDLMIACGIAKEDQEVAERMLKVAFCCVQYKPEARPVMSIVVKMLEGALEVPEPLNPFTHLFSGGVSDSLAQMARNVGGSDFSSSEAVSKSTVVNETPLMKRYEITMASERLVNNSRFIPLAMVQLLSDLEREKPIQFTSQQLKIATDNFTIKLGSGGYGTVYKGIISNNTPAVAVKVLSGTSDKSIEQQFMAEMSTLGRTHHFNLVRLYGFCFESSLRALVYEFMVNGSLDHYLFKADKKTIIGFKKLHEIALGSARGISYLHEECHQRIVHYDIKPGNILLDSNFCAKVADFGLAKLCDRDSSRMTGRVGTPGYTAPEVWMDLPVTYKCDVYSFGMLLFDIIGRRRNMDTSLGESQEWFPVWAWGKYEKKQLKDLMIACGIAKDYHNRA